MPWWICPPCETKKWPSQVPLQPYLCRSEEKWKRCLIATVNFPASTLSAFKPGPLRCFQQKNKIKQLLLTEPI